MKSEFFLVTIEMKGHLRRRIQKLAGISRDGDEL